MIKTSKGEGWSVLLCQENEIRHNDRLVGVFLDGAVDIPYISPVIWNTMQDSIKGFSIPICIIKIICGTGGSISDSVALLLSFTQHFKAKCETCKCKIY